MAAPLAVGAGADEGLDTFLNRMLVQQEVDERARHDQATEALTGRQLTQADSVKQALSALRQQQATALQAKTDAATKDEASRTSNRAAMIADTTGAVPDNVKVALRTYDALPPGDKTFPWQLIQPPEKAPKSLQTHFADIDMMDNGVPKHLKNVPVMVNPDPDDPYISFNGKKLDPQNVHSVVSPSAASGGMQVVQGENGFYLVNKASATAKPVTEGTGSQLGPKVTAQTQAMQEGAKMLRPNIQEVMQDASNLDKAGLFGPAMSRVRDLATRLGTTQLLGSDDPAIQQKALNDFAGALAADPSMYQDELTGRFTSGLKLLASGAGRVHGGSRGGGSIQMIEYMKDLLSSTSTLGMFRGRLQGLDRVLSHYATGPNAAPGGTSDSGSSGGGLPEVGSSFNGGIVRKVTPIQ